jgi:RNA polymerase sigma-70 factor (ECF subfamily)
MRGVILEALPKLRRFALSLTGNPPDADDLLQATVERALTRTSPTGKLDATKWMFRICRNLWIDELRSRKVRETATDSPESLGEPAADTETIVSELTFREVLAAMDELPDEQRSVLSLVAVAGMTYREAAEVLEVPIGTVMSRLARARAALAERFDEGDR